MFPRSGRRDSHEAMNRRGEGRRTGGRRSWELVHMLAGAVRLVCVGGWWNRSALEEPEQLWQTAHCHLPSRDFVRGEILGVDTGRERSWRVIPGHYQCVGYKLQKRTIIAVCVFARVEASHMCYWGEKNDFRKSTGILIPGASCFNCFTGIWKWPNSVFYWI